MFDYKKISIECNWLDEILVWSIVYVHCRVLQEREKNLMDMSYCCQYCYDTHTDTHRHTNTVSSFCIHQFKCSVKTELINYTAFCVYICSWWKAQLIILFLNSMQFFENIQIICTLIPSIKLLLSIHHYSSRNEMCCLIDSLFCVIFIKTWLHFHSDTG